LTWWRGKAGGVGAIACLCAAGDAAWHSFAAPLQSPSETLGRPGLRLLSNLLLEPFVFIWTARSGNGFYRSVRSRGFFVSKDWAGLLW